jgi:HK97 family phage prohead protease
MKAQVERRAIFEVPVVESREDSSPIVQGYAALFNNRTVIYDMFTEAIEPGAFTRALKERHDVRHLFNHDANYIIGRTKNGSLVLKEDERGLWTETTPPNTQQAKDVVENIRVGNVDQMSFAFTIDEEVWSMPEKKDELAHRQIRSVTLYDVSSVVYPAYSDTSVGLRSNAEQAYTLARSEWEKAKEPDAPIVITYDPSIFELKVRCLRAQR